MDINELDDLQDDMTTRRMLSELERHIRAVNRENILDVTGGISTIQVVALTTFISRLRARYLAEALAFGGEDPSGLPGTDSLARLRACREAYEEALQGFGALRHALRQGYFTPEQ